MECELCGRHNTTNERVVGGKTVAICVPCAFRLAYKCERCGAWVWTDDLIAIQAHPDDGGHKTLICRDCNMTKREYEFEYGVDKKEDYDV